MRLQLQPGRHTLFVRHLFHAGALRGRGRAQPRGAQRPGQGALGGGGAPAIPDKDGPGGAVHHEDPPLVQCHRVGAQGEGGRGHGLEGRGSGFQDLGGAGGLRDAKDQDPAILQQLKIYRSIPAAERPPIFLKLAKQISALPAGPKKVELADMLVNEVTEGDNGLQTLQAAGARAGGGSCQG